MSTPVKVKVMNGSAMVRDIRGMLENIYNDLLETLKASARDETGVLAENGNYRKLQGVMDQMPGLHNGHLSTNQLIPMRTKLWDMMNNLKENEGRWSKEFTGEYSGDIYNYLSFLLQDLKNSAHNKPVDEYLGYLHDGCQKTLRVGGPPEEVGYWKGKFQGFKKFFEKAEPPLTYEKEVEVPAPSSTGSSGIKLDLDLDKDKPDVPKPDVPKPDDLPPVPLDETLEKEVETTVKKDAEQLEQKAESWLKRFGHTISENKIAVAGVGIVVAGTTAYLLMRNNHKEEPREPITSYTDHVRAPSSQGQAANMSFVESTQSRALANENAAAPAPVALAPVGFVR